ncbi:hypothetical protein L1987_19813 [Smallanthus sonchifolius]|uniref:Uncharacterized protein n=1 Tax=Smallanthus sonchifolius TaxID=185202 RepID=A0ACB9IPN6_9ASTR|nr:hypothetical protein L1987_19813 [Smallanthus sonchifolius]
MSEFLLGSDFDRFLDQLSQIEASGLGRMNNNPHASKVAIESLPSIEFEEKHIHTDPHCAVCKEPLIRANYGDGGVPTSGRIRGFREKIVVQDLKRKLQASAGFASVHRSSMACTKIFNLMIGGITESTAQLRKLLRLQITGASC